MNLNIIELIYNDETIFIRINLPKYNSYLKIEKNKYQEIKYENENLSLTIFKKLKKFYFSSFIGEFENNNIKYLIFCENCSYSLNLNNNYNIYCIENIKIFDCKNKKIDENYSINFTNHYKTGFYFCYNYNLTINLFSPFEINNINYLFLVNRNYLENYIINNVQYFLVSLVYGQIIYNKNSIIFLRYSSYDEKNKYDYILVDLGYCINFDYFFSGFIIHNLPVFQESNLENYIIYNKETIEEKFNEWKLNFKINKCLIIDKGIKNLKNGNLIFEILNELNEESNYLIHTIEKKFINNKYLKLFTYIDIIKNNEYDLETAIFLPEFKKFWWCTLNSKKYLKKILCYIHTLFILKCQNHMINDENNIYKVSNLIYNELKENIFLNKNFEPNNLLMENIFLNYDLIKNFILSKESFDEIKNLKLSIITMNVGGIYIKNLKNITDLFPNKNFFDNELIVINLQEVVSMDKSNIHNIILNLGSEESEWREYFCKKLKKEFNYNLIYFSLFGGLLLMIFIKNNNNKILKVISTENIKMGPLGLFANKGCIFVKLNIEGYSFVFANCHLTAGYDNKAFQKRCENVTLIYNKIVSMNSDFNFIIGDLNFRCNFEELYFNDLLEKYKKSDDDETRKLIVKELFIFDELKNILPSYKNLKEENINFLPTYKFLKNGIDYNLTVKNRMPSYCDRILYNFKYNNYKIIDYNSINESLLSDHKPVFLDIEFNLPKFNSKKIVIKWNLN